MSAAEAELREAAGGHLAQAAARDTVGGMPARWVVSPGSTDEVAAVMRACSARDLAVVVRGAGTKLEWGQAPERLDVILDTTRLDAVVEHAAGDLVAVVQAGCRLEDLQRDLGKERQRLGVDPQRPGTVGGAVATAATGPLRLHHGAVRDLVIGMTLVRADGVIAHSGGKVVKNVAGYDLGKLLTGSYGTLGVITEVAFRLHPVPVARTWVTFTPTSADGIPAAVQAVVHSQVVPSAVELNRAAGRGTLAVLLEGHPDGLGARAAEVTDLVGGSAARSDAPPAWWGSEPGEGAGALLTVTHEIAALPELLDAVEGAEAASGCRASLRGSVAIGVASVAVTGGAEEVMRFAETLRRAAPLFGGSVVVREAPYGVKDRLDPWGPVRGLGLMRAVKERFDPGRRLAPGRFVGGI